MIPRLQHTPSYLEYYAPLCKPITSTYTRGWLINSFPCGHCSIDAILTEKTSSLILRLSLDQLQAFIYMAFQDIFAPSSIYPPCFLCIFKVGRNGVLKCMRNRKCGLQLEEGVGAKIIVSNGNKSVVVTIPKYTSLTG